MEQDVPDAGARSDRMPGTDLRPVKQLWDVHWSIVKQHIDAVRAAAAAAAAAAETAAETAADCSS